MDDGQMTTGNEGVNEGANEGVNEGSDAKQEQINSFSIPEEYSGKDWVKNFDGQTGDDLKANVFKALDEKYASTPVIPQSAEEYAFNEVFKDENGEVQFSYPDEVLNFFGNEFKELGITKEQGQGVLKKYTDFELKEFEKHTNADELEKNVASMFNGNSEQRSTVEGLLKEILPQEDQKFLQETMPNVVIEMFYKVAKGVVERYGLKEGTQNSNSTNSNTMRMTEKDKDAEYNRIVGEIEALSKRPHSPEERAKLQRQLLSLYE